MDWKRTVDEARGRYGGTNWLGDKLRMADAARRRVEWAFQPWPEYQHVGVYLRFAKAGLAGAGVKIHWTDDRLTAEQFRREFVRALQRRITCKGKVPRGRKWDDEYLIHLDQDRRFNRSRSIRQLAA